MFLKTVLAAAVAVMAAAAGKEEAASGAVPMLTSENFDKFVQDHPLSLVKFMAPWCGHCKKLAPEYEAAAEALKKEGSDVVLAEVDATNDRELAEKYDVHGFPTLFFFRNGKPEPYSGGRTKDTIIAWLAKMTGPAVNWVKDEKAAIAAAEGKAVAFVGAFAEKDQAKVFEEVADASREKGVFIAYTTKGATGTVRAMRANEDPAETAADTAADKKKLEAFVAEEAVPLFGMIGGDNYAMYAARSNNWVWVAGSKDDAEKYGPVIRKVSKNYRAEMNFVGLDTDAFKAHAENALGLTKFPGIAVIYEDIKYHYPDEMESMTEKSLTKFIQAVKTGKAEKFFKSEPVPESNDEPVKIVVGHTFDDMVLGGKKDVLLKVYAPWCGHCKKLAPVYEELAEKVKGNDHVVIAKIDGTANEIQHSDFKFQGFPTIFFVKAGAKKPEMYEGPRTVDGFVSYLEKHASKPITIKEDNGSDEL